MRYVCMMLACLLMVGCQEEEKWGIGNKTGFLVSLDDVSVEVTTRAASEEFNLVVTKEGITEPYEKTTLTVGSSTFVEVSAGTYNIKATSINEIENGVEWEPYYVANATAEITEEDPLKNISLTARYGCALLSVNFPEGLTDIFKEYYVEVNAVGKGSLKLTSSDQKAYIEAGEKVSLSFGGTKLNGDKVENKPLTHEDLPETFDAADYYKITLMMGDGLTMDISKVEEKTVEITEDIPLDWLPKPKMEAEGFDDNNNLNFVETETKTAKLGLDLSSELQDIKFKFAFQDEQFTESLQKDKEYLLSNAEDKAAIEKALGVTLPNVGDETGNIDFSALVAKMQTNAGTPTINSVEVDVKANNRWSSEVKEGDDAPNLKYTFTCNKPEFSVAVQPGNMWTKTFTIDEPTVTAGNAEVLKEKLVYQYREKGADDNAWQNCSNGLEQVFSTQPDKKEYEVRAYYREGIVSEVVDVELESLEQLPNSDMDGWQYEIYKEWESGWFNKTKHTYYSFMPWSKDEKKVWDTNNVYTTRHRYNSSTTTYDKNGLHAVSYVVGRNNSGLAAELRNTANGRGNNDITGVQSYNIVPGELFTGTAKLSMGDYGNIFNDADGSNDKFEPIKDAVFKSRPTALSFWYKYKPLDGSSDTWSVYIQLLDANGNTIVEKEEISSNSQQDWKFMTVLLPYEDDKVYSKCNYIFIDFKSSSKNGSDVPYSEQTLTFYIQESNGSLTAKTHSPAYIGSVLTIDDISLIYDK